VAARFVGSAVVLTAAWMIGVAVRQQRAYTAGLREQADRRVQAQLADGRRAATEERLRIARELHDVVAHSRSLIAVQAGVGHYVAGARPEEAERALASIEGISRDALREMRRLLGVSRHDGHRQYPRRTAAGQARRPRPGPAGHGGLRNRPGAAGVAGSVNLGPFGRI